MRLPLALLLALAVALAGCASEPEPAPARLTPDAREGGDEGAADDEGGAAGEVAEPDAASEAPMPPVTTFLNGTVTAVAAANEEPIGFCCPTIMENGENIEGTFRGEKGLTGVVVELHWTDTTFDLDLGLYAPDHEFLPVPEVNGTSITGSRGHAWWAYGGQIGSPDGHVAILIDDPEVLALEGDWGYRVSTKTASNVAFTVAITLFYGAPPTEAFTAFAPA